MNLLPEDLLLIKGWARKAYLDIRGGERLEGGKSELSHGDKIACAYFTAACQWLHYKKIAPGSVDLKYEVPDSDPEVEIADWTAEESKG